MVTDMGMGMGMGITIMVVITMGMGMGITIMVVITMGMGMGAAATGMADGGTTALGPAGFGPPLVTFGLATENFIEGGWHRQRRPTTRRGSWGGSCRMT
jgi:hypothetical protein